MRARPGLIHATRRALFGGLHSHLATGAGGPAAWRRIPIGSRMIPVMRRRLVISVVPGVVPITVVAVTMVPVSIVAAAPIESKREKRVAIII